LNAGKIIKIALNGGSRVFFGHNMAAFRQYVNSAQAWILYHAMSVRHA